jgi:RNA polymerase sigma-32 factor
MNKSISPLSFSLSASNLGGYIQWANQIPMLSEEEERDLFDALFSKGNLEAARTLILSHLRVVIKVARGYQGYGLAQEDLIQEGNIGLMKAVKRFKPEMGVRLVSFAMHWIRAEIHEYVIKNWRIVKIATTKAQRKLFFNIRKMAKSRTWFSNQEVDIIADTLNVNTESVRHMEARLSAFDESFDAPDLESESETAYSPAHYLAAPESTNPEACLIAQDSTADQLMRLKSALATLDNRSRALLYDRWLSAEKPTLQALGQKYGVSAERIRQLEKAAMQKVARLVKEN